MHLCNTRPWKTSEYQQLTTICECQVFVFFSFLGGASSVRDPSHNSGMFSQQCCSVPDSPEFSVTLWRFDVKSHILWAAAGCVYSQVSRLSLSMCDPERTVSMSIRRSELRPSGMLGISSSPSDIGSTGIDSCKVIEEVSPESPEEVEKEDEMTELCGRFKYLQWAGRNLGIWISIFTAALGSVCVKVLSHRWCE